MVEGDDRSPPVQQNVTAVAGFAYGVVGADIHCFGDGAPVYVLESWQPAPAADPEFLRELPSRMLNARFAVVDFTGRENELAELRRWREEGPRLSVRWLHAPGGQGKTRLAAQFARESLTEGWKVVTATHGPGAILPPPGSQDLRLGGAAGQLVVIDYADQWPLTHLTWLFNNSLFHDPAVRTRALMLARSADAWPAVRGALANHQAGTSAHALATLPGGAGGVGPGPRLEMFTAARDSFAVRYDADAAAIDPPGPLEQPDFGLTLAVHIAALVAVDAHVTRRRPPSGIGDLTIYLLDREHLHWARLYADGSHHLNPADPTYHTPPEVMNRTVFAAALTGALPRGPGIAVLDGLRMTPGPARILADHGACYPPAVPDRATVLEPLYPDRLAEDFLALTLPGHAADYPAQAWAAPTAEAVLTRGGGDVPATWTARAITFLAAAAARWPHVGPDHLFPLLRADPRLALAAGSAALIALASLDDADPVLLEAIAARFPDHRDADLDAGIAAVAQRLAAYRIAEAGDPAEQARVHQDLGVRLFNAGRFDEALAASEEAVARWRLLVSVDPATYEPGLAQSLIDLGLRLHGVGRAEEALTVDRQAVAIHHLWAEVDPATYEPGLAQSLNNLSLTLTFLGRRSAALDAGREAVEVYRRLARTDPAYEPGLAQALNSLGMALFQVGRRRKAVPAGRDAVAIYLRLARVDPATYEPDLASSLSNLGAFLAFARRREEAVSAGREAVALWRRLAAANPAMYEGELAGALSNLGSHLLKVGRREEARTVTSQAAASFRRLFAVRPAAFDDDMRVRLRALSRLLDRLGRPEDAGEIRTLAVAPVRHTPGNSEARR